MPFNKIIGVPFYFEYLFVENEMLLQKVDLVVERLKHGSLHVKITSLAVKNSPTTNLLYLI